MRITLDVAADRDRRSPRIAILGLNLDDIEPVKQLEIWGLALASHAAP